MPDGARITYVYDANGNMTSENRGGVTTHYAYNPENRNTKVTNPDGSVVTYTYGADGLRRKIQDSTGVTTVIYDGRDYLKEEK